MIEDDFVKLATPQRAQDQVPASRVTPAAWMPEPQALPCLDTEQQPSPLIDEAGEDTLHRSASRPIDGNRPRTMFRRAYLGLKQGLQRLGGFVLAHGFRN